jgi:predicted transcriptional regulator of viral defense system
VLWEVAAAQHGYFTLRDASAEGIDDYAVRMLAARNQVTRVAHGLYRFDKFPVTRASAFMEAVLWTGTGGACLSHETVLAVRELCDINPDRIHLTIPRDRRVRRAGGDRYVLHYQDLDTGDVGWWNEVPAVTAACAIWQCIGAGTPTYLLRQALDTGRRRGDLVARVADELDTMLAERA